MRARLLAQICLLVRRKDSSAATLLIRLLARRRKLVVLGEQVNTTLVEIAGELRDLFSPCGWIPNLPNLHPAEDYS